MRQASLLALLNFVNTLSPLSFNLSSQFRSIPTLYSHFILFKGRYKGLKPKKDCVADWVSKNDNVARSLPIYVGGGSLVSVLINRAVFGIAPVVDASSSQFRADLLTLALVVTNILASLVWITIRPKPESMKGVFGQ